MGLKLEKGLKHQIDAINAINEVFEDVPFLKSKYNYSNPLINLSSSRILENIKKLNKKLPSSLKSKIGIEEYLNLDIKMETGTGKTYVYTKTIFELNKNFGIHKFIILVPSLPIKLGTTNFIKSDETINHFKDQYNKSIDLYVLDSKKNTKKGRDGFPSSIRGFVETSSLMKDRISVLIVNMQLFKDNSILTREYSSTVEDFYNPSDAINATRPFIIIDEPHRFSKGNKTFEFINNRIKPQCVIRFGATFPDIKIDKKIEKDYHNLIYNLSSCDAFNNNLVKGVKVRYLESPSGNNVKVKLLDLINKKKVRLQLITENRKKTYELEKGDSLKTIDDAFENIFVDGIGKTLLLSNGLELNKGSEIYTDTYSTSYQKVMLKNALDVHFQTEKQNFKRSDKIKTLALFFIDDIDSYRENKNNPTKTYLKDIFENLLKEKLKQEIQNIDERDEDELLYKEYLLESLNSISSTHGGYFSKDNNDSDENIASEINKILVNKEETLSIYKNNGKFNTFRFIFSKWTLKEGWDNPNIFTITKLRSSGSEISKIQEVGRGLRLPVNINFSRISDEQFYLNYIVDFTEKDFASRLINEINGDIIENKIITEEQLSYLSDKLGKEIDDIFIELLSKKYIDRNKNIIIENRDSLFSEYPDLCSGLKANKVINETEKKVYKSKIKKDKFEQIKELWNVLNRKYFITYSDIKEEDIVKNLVDILKSGIDGIIELISFQQTIETNNEQAFLIKEAGMQYSITEEVMPYNEFLNKVYKFTNIPIKLIHKALVKYNELNSIADVFFNNNTAINFIYKINEWKYKTFLDKFKYTYMGEGNIRTSLTNSKGEPLDYVEGNLGNYYSKDKTSDKYLYDLCWYDSDLEKNNITIDHEDVIVFAKIPSRSIRIPLINGMSYSPDFMYIIKKQNNQKELNLVLETKDYKSYDMIPTDQQYKIEYAKKFFEQLNSDGYDVNFKVQISNIQISNLIKNID